ncbi:MAG TPA: hypothetical protein DCS05_05455 [Nitrospiraceae bacterium]|nr:hypothetical protein [Nitrospiraceae bacterium]
MKPTRSTRLAERILFFVCLMIGAFFAGQALAPDPKLAACVEIPAKKMPLNWSKKSEKRWIAYWGRQR